MSDAPAPRAPDRAPDLMHLELVEREVSRHRQNGLRLRVGALALVAGYIAVHGAQSQPRYMFLAPFLGLALWALDAHADWNARALRALARAIRGEAGPRPAPMSLDVGPFADQVSWRQCLLRPARALYFHPVVTAAAYVAIDAPRLDPDGVPSELFWYLAVTFLAFLALVVVAWSWWYDRFGVAPAYPAALPAPSPSFQAFPAPQPPSVPARIEPLRAEDSPFPTPPPSPAVVVPPRTDATRPFGTAVG